MGTSQWPYWPKGGSVKTNPWILGGISLLCGAWTCWAEVEILGQIVLPPEGEGSKSGTVVQANQPVRGAPGEDLLQFFNDDRLHGTLTAITNDALTWSSPDSLTPLNLALNNVKVIDLALPAATGPTTSGAMVELTNGDSFGGRIVSLDEETLVLATEFAGELKIARCMVGALYPNAGGTRALYSGPGELSDWIQQNSSSWFMEEEALCSRGSNPIGRSIEGLPDQVAFEFDMEWTSSADFSFSFLSDNLQPYNGNAYALRFRPSAIQLTRCTQNNGSQTIGTHEAPELFGSNKRTANIQVLVDKKQRTFVVLVDGQKIKEWADPAGMFAGLGSNIVFQSSSSSYRIKISKVVVRKWNGRIPGAKSTGSKDEDLVRFGNDDKVSGSLKRIAEDEALLQTRYAEMKVPVDRIECVVFAEAGMARARRNSGDIRAHFAGGDSLTFQLAGLDATNIKGSSENWGEAVMPLRLFKRLEFNIYDKRRQGQ